MISAYLLNYDTKDDICYLANKLNIYIPSYDKKKLLLLKKPARRAILKARFIYNTKDKLYEDMKREDNIYLFESIEFTARLLSPVKILSFDILRQPVITENSNAEFVFKADSNNERINLTISS